MSPPRCCRLDRSLAPQETLLKTSAVAFRIELESVLCEVQEKKNRVRASIPRQNLTDYGLRPGSRDGLRIATD